MGGIRIFFQIAINEGLNKEGTEIKNVKIINWGGLDKLVGVGKFPPNKLPQVIVGNYVRLIMERFVV